MVGCLFCYVHLKDTGDFGSFWHSFYEVNEIEGEEVGLNSIDRFLKQHGPIEWQKEVQTEKRWQEKLEIVG